MAKKKTITFRVDSEDKELFLNLFEASGANSHGEFLQELIDKWKSKDVNNTPEERTIPIN